MKLKLQKRLAASIMGCSEKKIRFDPTRLEDIKESITKADVRSLIIDKAIFSVKEKGVSRGRARKKARQKRKGLQKGLGSRKGKKLARLPKRDVWANKSRAQKALLKRLRNNGIITKGVFRNLYMKVRGGFFRSVRHIKLYIGEHDLITKKTK
jgi:large subunit ribosomal protein L19e